MLNIRQLDYFIDSLGTSIRDRRSNLAQNYPRNYKVYLNLDSTYQRGSDTSIMITQDFLGQYTGEERARITSAALSSARNIKKTLDYHLQSLASSEEYLIKHKIVWHRKFTLSFACLVLFFIGAPLGAIIRKGGLGLPAVVSVLFFILYHIISMIGEKSALKGAMGVPAGMWLSSIILLPLGFFLALKATTDSPLMDMDIWNKVFMKFNPARFFPKRLSGLFRATGKTL
jgi:lipopolysaccharide export system permease protein